MKHWSSETNFEFSLNSYAESSGQTISEPSSTHLECTYSLHIQVIFASIFSYSKIEHDFNIFLHLSTLWIHYYGSSLIEITFFVNVQTKIILLILKYLLSNPFTTHIFCLYQFVSQFESKLDYGLLFKFVSQFETKKQSLR